MIQHFRSRSSKINTIKKSLLIAVLSLLSFHNLNAQEAPTETGLNSFIEWNVGVAYIGYDYFLEDVPLAPGTSILFGETLINKKNWIIEYEVGLAFPTIATGKIGIGKQFNKTKVVIGVRPFPANIFLQSNFSNGKKGYWIASAEISPFLKNEKNTHLSFYSLGIFNVGYRWSLFKNK